jgi:succinyl-CoA synthetase beta subunit
MGPARQAAFAGLLDGLWRCFRQLECELVEVNPLALTEDAGLVALDAKVVADDRSRGRHPELAGLGDEPDPLDAAAARLAVYPVPMQGDIAVAAAGAGALMATLDYVQALGGTLAGGLDLGGVVGHRPAELVEALGLTRAFAPRAFLFNFYVRGWRCDVLAEAVLEAVGDLRPRCPVMVRLAGNRAAEGRAILGAAGVPTSDALIDACRYIVAAVR